MRYVSRPVSVFLFLTLSTLACKTVRHQASEIKWAHTPATSSTSIINARLQYLLLGYQADFKALNVCIQDATFYKGPTLLLETKLAYAAWLDASGQGSEIAWNLFHFTIQPHCNMLDTQFSSVVVIDEVGKITPEQQVDKSFTPSKVSCKRSGKSASCSTGSMLMGLGGTGTIAYQFVTPETWERVTNSAPATVILSPYADWISLENELSKTPLITHYKDLTARGDTLTFAELKAFNAELDKRILKPSSGIDAIVKAFLASKDQTLEKTFVPIQPAFHVLLHEVGHQFGMDHADNPNLDSETGLVGQAEKVPVQGQNPAQAPIRFITSEATMAYADEYLYLTADDKAGINDLAIKNLDLLKTHFKAKPNPIPDPIQATIPDPNQAPLPYSAKTPLPVPAPIPIPAPVPVPAPAQILVPAPVKPPVPAPLRR
ncbi:MAG: hypothetical protein H7249_04585 [Chitinophagaceae bacterium]|nr:hypothetical protein [Oligoflexus sp.]